MRKIHYGWVVCAVCTALLFFTVGLTSTTFTIFMSYFIDAGGLSQTQGGVILMARSLASLLSIPAIDKLYRFIGFRLGFFLSAVALAGAFFLYSIADVLSVYCIAAVISGLCYTIGGTIPVSLLIAKWFQSDRAFALGICAAGSGATAIIMPPLMTGIVETYSLDVLLVMLGIASCTLGIVVFMCIINDPKEKNLKPFYHIVAAKQGENTMFYGNHVENRVVMIMFAAMFAMGMGLFGAMQYMASFLGFQGFSEMGVSLLISTYGVTLFWGKMVFGWVTDHMGGRRSGLIFFSVAACGFVITCMAQPDNMGLAIAAMLCMGFSLPLVSVGVPTFARDIGTEETYSANMARLQFAFMLGSTVVGTIPGAIADLTSSYVLAYIFLGVMTISSMLLVQLAYIRMKKMACVKEQDNS